MTESEIEHLNKFSELEAEVIKDALSIHIEKLCDRMIEKEKEAKKKGRNLLFTPAYFSQVGDSILLKLKNHTR